MLIRATTAPGVEDVARDEGARLLAVAGFAVRGHERRSRDGASIYPAGVVTWDVGERPAASDLFGTNPLAAARSLFHVAVHVAEIEWDGATLESLLAGVRKVDLPEMTSAASFRVSCAREGEHDFHSPDVERAVGAIEHERYGTGVDLEHYQVHLKIDVVNERAFVGYQLTGRKGLDRRYPWVYHPRVTLRTPIAFAMLSIAGFVRGPGALHDPFCGAGTIVLEAAGICADLGCEPPRLGGSDRDPEAVAGARRNLAAAGIRGAAIEEADARELSPRIAPGSLDYIVTNPPFGIRLARGSNFASLYARFLASAAVVLREGGTLALLVGKRRGDFNRVLAGESCFAFRHARVIEMGGVYPALFVLERTKVPAPG